MPTRLTVTALLLATQLLAGCSSADGPSAPPSSTGLPVVYEFSSPG